MIIKSYEVNKASNLKNNFFLFYGENQGLKEECISKNFKKNFKNKTFKYNESEILNNTENFYNQILSNSFFENEKLIIIFRATDKILGLIEDIINRKVNDIKIILNSNALDTRSKLRKFFEKNPFTVCVPFYEDNDQTLSLFAQNFFKEKKISISQESINLLVNRSNKDRIHLKNELDKIEVYAKNKTKINIDEILSLSNLSENHKISELVDCSLVKNRKKTFNIINENNFSSDDCVYILRIFILKIKRLLKIHENLKVTNNLETTISSYKPTIFWKEKEIVKQQINKLDIETLNSLITKTNDIELLVKKRPLLSTYVVSNFIIEQTN